MEKIDPRFRLAYVLSKQSDISILLAIAGFLISVGFIFGQAEIDNNYNLIYNFANKYTWSAIFAAYASSRALDCFFGTRLEIKIITGIVGIWAWLYVFLSFTIADSMGMSPTEYLLIAPVIAECWVMIKQLIRQSDTRRDLSCSKVSK
jgi:hypothetical protein